MDARILKTHRPYGAIFIAMDTFQLLSEAQFVIKCPVGVLGDDILHASMH